jgi:hypothetical protein
MWPLAGPILLFMGAVSCGVGVVLVGVCVLIGGVVDIAAKVVKDPPLREPPAEVPDYEAEEVKAHQAAWRKSQEQYARNMHNEE